VFQFTIPNHGQKKKDEKIGPEPLPRAEPRQPAAAPAAREPVAILRAARRH
jgi:hypothetical protein